MACNLRAAAAVLLPELILDESENETAREARPPALAVMLGDIRRRIAGASRGAGTTERRTGGGEGVGNTRTYTWVQLLRTGRGLQQIVFSQPARFERQFGSCRRGEKTELGSRGRLVGEGR